MEKRNVTGLISSIYWDYIKNLSISRPDEALKRNFSGVQVQNNSHAPSGGVSVNARDNASSIIGGRCPLGVMDGMPITTDLSTIRSSDTGTFGAHPNPLKSIGPSDIGSIQIIIDNFISSIYISQVAIGVVLISNKRDRINQQDINFKYSFNIAEHNNKLLFLLEQQWLQQEKESVIMLGEQNVFTDQQVAGLDNGTDWKDVVYKTVHPNYSKLLFSG